MDWQSKFYSIVRETEENLAKAKTKLAAKSVGLTNSLGAAPPPQHAVNVQDISQGVGGNRLNTQCFSQSLSGPSLSRYQQREAPGYTQQTEELNMSAASGIQVLHMQEQIDAQNRTIDQLQRLVRSLDSERDFYKEQISHLRGEVDSLTGKMSHQLLLTGSERQMSQIKQEVLREIDKVKTMLHSQSRQSKFRASHLSPRVDDELWSVKENLTESLEHVRRELSLMNKRIDRMESGLSCDSTTGHDSSNHHFNTSHFQRSPRNHTSSYTANIDPGFDAHQLRSTVNLLNTKMGSLERRIDAASQPNPNPYSALHANTPYIPTSSATEPYLRPTYDDNDDVDDLSSLSGLSDIGDLSDDDDGGDGELDDEIDAIIKRSSYHVKNNIDADSAVKSSLYKMESRKKGKVEFDLSDLDLSDVEAADVDSVGLDL